MSEQPDTAGGNYYITVRRENGDFRCLAGPYRDNHAAALAAKDKVASLAINLDPKAAFYSFGTIRTDYSYAEPGILNRLGLIE